MFGTNTLELIFTALFGIPQEVGIAFLFFVCIDLLILLAFGLVMGIEKYNTWRAK